ncbi:MAG: hypothetical protein A2W36_06305 [Chloroflexi bacterium RBG_16_58_14]|nr:MAG: hypothetical protein A2W36_06305 [Chloroflexi bacterium RBG_16_58_14]
MQIGKSFTYVFEDAKWFTKLLLGAVVSIVPILNFAFIGYTTEIIRRVSRDDPEPLAGWDDFGKMFVDGLLLALAGLVYSIPIILLAIPMFPVLMAASSGDSDTVMAAMTGLGIVLGCLIGLYGLFLTVFYPAVQINYSRKGTFGSCFQIGTIIKVATSNFGNYLLAWLMYIVFAMVIGFIGGILSTFLAIIPCLGWILSLIVTAIIAPMVGVVYAHLFGQVAAQNT